MSRQYQDRRVELVDESGSTNPGPWPEIRALVMSAGDETLATVETGRTLVDRRRLIGIAGRLIGRRRPIKTAKARQSKVDQLNGIGIVGMAIGGAVGSVEARGDGSCVPPFRVARHGKHQLQLMELALVAQIAGEANAARGLLDPVGGEFSFQLLAQPRVFDREGIDEIGRA